MRAETVNFRVQGLSADFRPRAQAIAETITENMSTFAKAARVKPYKLRSIRFRIYPFSRKDCANELFVRDGKKKYVCLNSALLKRRQWAALQYLLHGMAHSLCYLRDGIAEEVFCEYLGYKVLQEIIKNKTEKEQRRILKSVVKTSHPSYRAYWRAARRLTEEDPEKLLKLNNKAKNRKLAKLREKQIFYKALKARRDCAAEELEDFNVNLEKGFRKI